VNFVVVERRDGDGKFPVETVFHVFGGRTDSCFGPDFDDAGLAIAEVVDNDRAADAAGASAAVPDNVVVDGIHGCEAAFAAGDAGPFAARNGAGAAASKAELQAIARAAIGAAVLLVSVDVVGNLIVHSDVVDLSNGKLDVVPGAPAIDGNADAAVVHHSHATCIGGVDPHFVIVAAGARGHVGESFAAIESVRKRGREKVDFVFVVGSDLFARVVMSAAAELAVGVDELPVFSAVLGAPELAGLRGLAIEWNAVAGFDFGINAS